MTVEVWERKAAPTQRRERRREPQPIGRMSSVLAAQPWFRSAPVQRRRELAGAIEAERRRCHERTARVKAHPDLTAKLVRAMGYARFDQWNGYVPPSTDSDGLPNRCPRRAALIEVLVEVARRDSEGDGGEA